MLVVWFGLRFLKLLDSLGDSIHVAKDMCGGSFILQYWREYRIVGRSRHRSSRLLSIPIHSGDTCPRRNQKRWFFDIHLKCFPDYDPYQDTTYYRSKSNDWITLIFFEPSAWPCATGKSNDTHGLFLNTGRETSQLASGNGLHVEAHSFWSISHRISEATSHLVWRGFGSTSISSSTQ